MKLKKQDKPAVKGEEENGQDETTTTTTNEESTSAHMHLTNEDKEKGNFKHFNISKKTVKKLKGRFR